MKPLIKQFDAAYVPAEWDGINRSGIRVVGKTVLVLMDTASGKTAGEHGGQLELTDDYVEKMTAQAISGVLVAVSEGAFCVNEDGSPWSGEKPRPSDRVNVAKYSGTQIPGRDGKIYRLMDYGCIGGVYAPEAEYLAFIAAEEERLGIVPAKVAVEHLDAITAAGLIDYRCAELNIPQADGPACAYLETKGGSRHIYVTHRTQGIERINAERSLASSVKNAIEADKVLVWRCRPEVQQDPTTGQWYAYCRFVQIERGEEVLPLGDDGFVKTELELAVGTHNWDPEDMKCRDCGTKLVDVTENGANAECSALSPHGAAVAA